MSRFRITLLGFALLACGARAAFAADARVTAVLSNSEADVGQPVQLEIQVTGVSNPKPPTEITVDGLEIQAAGTSRQYQMNNFDISYSFTFTYTVTPLRAGRFVIPPQQVEAGGQILRTPELALNAADATDSAGRSGRSTTNAKIDPSQIGFIEMLLPKSVAYVGEMVPVQIRVGLNMRAPLESLPPPPQIEGQGFTTQKITDPRRTIETINGRSYQVMIIKTAISPVRSGKIEIGPVSMTPVVRVPRTGRQSPALPRGGPFDDPFFNDIFNDPAFAPSVRREVNLRSESATLEVKPLPPKAPVGFSGAVGTFTMTTEAEPQKAQVGDPITVTTTITGRGNFDRVNAPILSDDKGWHTYPPSDNFKQDDDVGISGAKTFETVLSAKEDKQALPPMTFSFFDPVKESYVTLRSEEIPLQIQGGTPPAPTPLTAATSAPSNSRPPVAATPPPEQARDILPQLDDRTNVSQTFQPLYEQRIFWLAQLVPFAGWLGFLGWKWRTARLNNREARRVAKLQHEAAEVQRKMRRKDASAQEYLADASRAVQLKTALVNNVNPNAVDAEAATAAFRLDANERARLQQLFAQRDELRYSGGRNGNNALSSEQRREILELVENLRP